MTERRPSGVVYDLGYAPHEGPRLGRAGAVRATIKDGIRRVLGIRRRARKKVLPWMLLGIAVLPAIAFVGFAFLTSNFLPESNSPFGSYAQYFNLSANVVLLFVALAAPELLIPDREEGVLAVYSSRPLTVADYLGAKAGALSIVIAGFLLVPQLLLYVGFAAIDNDGFVSTLVSESGQLLRVLLAAVVYLVAYAGPAVLVAVFTKRLAPATGVYLFLMFASNGIAEGVTQSADLPGARFGSLLALGDHPHYVRDWIFDESTSGWIPERAGFEPWVSLVVIVAVAALTAYFTIRRYRRIM